MIRAGRYTSLYGAIAQLGERLVCIQEVCGSIPHSSTTLAQGEQAALYQAVIRDTQKTENSAFRHLRKQRALFSGLCTRCSLTK